MTALCLFPKALQERIPLYVLKQNRAGFSLVEVTVALGIFAFAVLSVVGLLSVALNTANDTNEDDSLASIIETLNAQVLAIEPSTIATTELFYDLNGVPREADDSNVHYRATLTPVSSATVMSVFTLSSAYPELVVWNAQIAHPAPVYTETTSILLSRNTD